VPDPYIPRSGATGKQNSPGPAELSVASKDGILNRNLVSGGGSVGDGDNDDGLLELTGPGGTEDEGLKNLLVERSSERGETWC